MHINEHLHFISLLWSLKYSAVSLSEAVHGKYREMLRVSLLISYDFNRGDSCFYWSNQEEFIYTWKTGITGCIGREILAKKNHICFENTPRRSPTIHIWCRSRGRKKCHIDIFVLMPRLHCSLLPLPLAKLCIPQKDVSGLGDLDIWPMTLTLELDLDIFTPDIHAKIQACMCVPLARIVRRTDGHTDRQTDNAKTITPSADAGCNKTRHYKLILEGNDIQ